MCSSHRNGELLCRGLQQCFSLVFGGNTFTEFNLFWHASSIQPAGLKACSLDALVSGMHHTSMLKPAWRGTGMCNGNLSKEE